MVGLPWWLRGKEFAFNAGNTEVDLIPGLGRSPGEGSGNPLQYFCLGNPMDRGTWWAIIHGVTKSQTQLSTSHPVKIMLAIETDKPQIISDLR